MTLQSRKFQKRDISELFAWFETEELVLAWAGAALTWPLQRRAFVELLKHDGQHSPYREVWAVDRSDEMIGHFQIVFNRRLRTAGLGRIALAPHVRGEGLSKTLMTLILDHAFAPAWVHRVELNVFSQNARAISAYERAGFIFEGSRRQTTPIQGEIWDTHLMSILRPEFDKRTERE